MMKPLRFDVDTAQAAADAWGFNCGPGAIAALCGLTPDELRPWLIRDKKRATGGWHLTHRIEVPR